MPKAGDRLAVAAAGLVAISVVLSTACGAGGPAAVGPGGSAVGDKVTLTYFNARGAEAVERKLIERYQAQHPTVDVEYQATTTMQGPSDTDAIANLIFNIQAGTPVDVAKVEVGRTPLDLMAANSDLDLSKLGGQAVKQRLGELQNAQLVEIMGGVWGLPYEYDPFGLVYNASMFKDAGLDPDRPPGTWDDLRAIATALKARFPNAWPICHPIKNLNKTQPYVWGAGGTYWDRDVLPTRADLTNPGLTAAYGFLREWSQKGWMNTEELSTDKIVQFMGSRQCASVNWSSYLVRRLRASDASTDWRVASIPAQDASHQPTNYAGGSALVVLSTSKHPKEALDFILWLTDVETQRVKFGIDTGVEVPAQDLADQAAPVTRSLTTDPKLRQDPNWSGVLLNVPTRPAGISPVYSKAYELLADMQERIIRTNSDIAAEEKGAQDKIQALLDDDRKQHADLYQ